MKRYFQSEIKRLKIEFKNENEIKMRKNYDLKK